MKNLRLEVCGTFHKEERGYIAYRDAASGAVYNERKEKCVRQKKDINSRKISFPFALYPPSAYGAEGSSDSGEGGSKNGLSLP